MRKPVMRTRKQIAYAAQELPSQNRTDRTGGAGESRVSFCEIRGFTEQKETLDSPVSPAPDPGAQKKRPAEAGPFMEQDGRRVTAGARARLRGRRGPWASGPAW